MNAEAQIEIEHERSVLDQQVVIAARPVRDLDLPVTGRNALDDRTSAGARAAPPAGGGGWAVPGGAVRIAVARDAPPPSRRRAGRPRSRRASRSACSKVEQNEAHRVARGELADLPQLGLHDRRGTDEAAEARAVGAEDDRHVAGEVDGADRVGVVVDVRRMQAGLAAVGARPLRLRADQAHAGAAAVEVHLPFGGEQRVDVVGREEVGRAVRTIEDADAPVARVAAVASRRAARAGGRCAVGCWCAAPGGARRRSAAPGRRGRRSGRA